jgi:diadenosine tetraphosphate (Ap4A) HIT family hydrolase
VVPQLHVHHIVRFETDPAWPAPVWGRVPPQPYDEAARRAFVERLAPHVAGAQLQA